MKVNGSRGAPPAGTASGPRPSAAPGFTVTGAAAETASAGQAARVSGVGAVGSLDALLALQAAEGPLERRRRAVSRGGRILDMLEQVKLALLEGAGAGVQLEKLARAVREERAGVDDEALESVLNEIDTRAAVEMAKAEMSRLAA